MIGGLELEKSFFSKGQIMVSAGDGDSPFLSVF
jgi:hypothetical protein